MSKPQQAHHHLTAATALYQQMRMQFWLTKVEEAQGRTVGE
jgi:hypothetical protein